MFKALVAKARATEVIGLSEISIQELYELCASGYQFEKQLTKKDIEEKSMESLSRYCVRNKIGLLYVEDGKLMLDFDVDNNTLELSDNIIVKYKLKGIWGMKAREALQKEEDYRLVELQAKIDKIIEEKLPIAMDMYAMTHKLRLNEYNGIIANGKSSAA
ncbi:hypothetical protein [Shewanella frigidimarina]|uniref:hypothetical protein n=1 Tax=Shewanella frigidimarina TaxID=56812 RepID=UPI003D7B54EA